MTSQLIGTSIQLPINELFRVRLNSYNLGPQGCLPLNQLVHTNIFKFGRGIVPLLEKTFLRRGKYRNIAELVVWTSNNSFNDRMQVGQHPLDRFSIEPLGIINKL